jgi:iron complex outermembrane receptor protein
MLRPTRFSKRRTLYPAPLAQAVSSIFVNKTSVASVGFGALLLALQSGAAIAQTAPVAPAAVPVDSGSAVIVTGTRRSGLKAIDSASPVQVIDSGSLERTGQPDLIQAIAQNIPSFTAQAVGGDTANLTLSARLRGLSPNDTLVLINGKRRHTTGNLAVLGGPYQGGAAADLNFIPVSAIDHIEVLQDGAAAQYGTDAIAGVVNIILKKESSGGSISTTAGKYFDEGGRTGDVSANLGFELGDRGFMNLSAESKYHGHSDRGGIDPRVVDATNLKNYPILTSVPGYPYVNHISGDAAYHLQVLALNAGYKITNDTDFYANATYGAKTADAFENYRMPSRLPKLYPMGFSPRETIDETDFGLSLGVKGHVGDWNWDLSTTYGKDNDKIGVINGGNVSLYNDTGSTPVDFHAGTFIASQWTTNLDVSRELDFGWKTPATLAMGLEHRTDTYEIGAGDPGSRYKEGSQSYPGFLLTDAGKHDRTNSAFYVDLAGSPIPELKLDVAARTEKFSDFGNATVGKLTGRYDFSPAVGLRSTISSGFRAPTMAEQFYSATNVSPTSAFVQLAPNSAGAKLVGVNGLKPEKSDNYSIGFVLKPFERTTITLDAYQISIKDHIVGSGSVYGSGGDVNSPAVVAAIKANGNVLDPTVTQTGINIFSNAVDTRTRGLEAVYSYNEKYGDMGRVDWTASATWNETTVTKINTAPTQLLPQTLLDKAAISDLETASPKYRINLAALWKKGPWTVSVREAIYGPSSEYGTEDGGTYFKTEISAKALTDLDVSYALTKALTLTIGANNLFNKYPDGVNPGLLAAQRAGLDNAAVTIYPSFSPIGINGGYYYARLNYTF